MHETEFFWTLSGDDNRVQDGMDLRVEFQHQFARGMPQLKFKPFVSILEVTIAVSRMLEFVAGGRAPEWAWKLIENLKLNHCYDRLTDDKVARVDDILEALVWRTYQSNGRGGYFPLIYPKEDQTKVEIWYQLNAYVNEIIES